MQNRLLKLVNTKAVSINDTTNVDISTLSETKAFPVVIKPTSYGVIITHWIKENRQLLHEKLERNGAVLFRGFKIDTVEKFQDFINVFDAAPLQYKNRSSPRFEVAKNIYHSTTYPADQHINMHSENSYLPVWPMNIVFCCTVPAREQGETPIADNRLVYQYLSDETRQKFITRGVKYIRHIAPYIGLPWQEVFQTKDKFVVETESIKNGMSFQWINEDELVLEWTNKAIYEHPVTKEKIWFNHAFFFNKYALDDETLASFGSYDRLPFNTCYGDGSEITKSEIEEIKVAYRDASVIFPWIKGDVLFMDNMLIAHARMPYKGDRNIIVSMF